MEQMHFFINQSLYFHVFYPNYNHTPIQWKKFSEKIKLRQIILQGKLNST